MINAAAKAYYPPAFKDSNLRVLSVDKEYYRDRNDETPYLRRSFIDYSNKVLHQLLLAEEYLKKSQWQKADKCLDECANNAGIIRQSEGLGGGKYASISVAGYGRNNLPFLAYWYEELAKEIFPYSYAAKAEERENNR